MNYGLPVEKDIAVNKFIGSQCFYRALASFLRLHSRRGYCKILLIGLQILLIGAE